MQCTPCMPHSSPFHHCPCPPPAVSPSASGSGGAKPATHKRARVPSPEHQRRQLPPHLRHPLQELTLSVDGTPVALASSPTPQPATAAPHAGWPARAAAATAAASPATAPGAASWLRNAAKPPK